MTRIYLDEQEVRVPLEKASSLDQILHYIEKSHLPAGFLISQIEVDGHPIVSKIESPEEPRDPESAAAERYDRIDIFTGRLYDIARDSIGQAIGYLDRIESATPALARRIRANPGPESFQDLAEVYEGFYWLSLLLDRLERTFHANADNVGNRTARDQEKLTGILRDLVSAQEQEDHVLLSDLLEYEILPFIPAWKALFRDLEKRTSDR